MAAVIKVTTTADKVAKHLVRVAREQLPFAMSKSLNIVADGAKQQVRARLIPKRFTLRNTHVKRGILVIRSHKSQFPNIQAKIGSRDKFMEKQELGGIKRKGGDGMTIPTNEPRISKSPKRIVPRGRWAGRIRGKKGLFKVKSARGATIFQEKGRGKRRKAKAWWFLRRRVAVKPRFGLRNHVMHYARANYGRQFLISLKFAFKTRRPK